MIKITECPRDAMQGIKEFISTEVKIKYINLLLKVGFYRIDFGSFVSPKSIPQMQDTVQVLEGLQLNKNSTPLLAIVANLRGAKEASQFEQISVIGFPFSVSETFQQRNTNSSINESLKTVEQICNICEQTNTLPLAYLSMGFGNPYGDEWNAEIVSDYAQQLLNLGVKELVLADTVGSSTPDAISYIYPMLKKELPNVPWGLHLHSNPATANEKIQAALTSGCDQFDSALRGFGGCPMANDHLVGNIATEVLLSVLRDNGYDNCEGLDQEALQEALVYSQIVFK